MPLLGVILPGVPNGVAGAVNALTSSGDGGHTSKDDVSVGGDSLPDSLRSLICESRVDARHLANSETGTAEEEEDVESNVAFMDGILSVEPLGVALSDDDCFKSESKSAIPSTTPYF